MKQILLSDCCRAPVKTEIWISKIVRRIRYCEDCGRPCRAIKQKKEAAPTDKKVTRFIYFFVV